MTDDGSGDREVADADGSEYTWRDQMVGERMAVDQQFSQRVAASDFSNQEWGLIMTATTFEVEDPGDPEGARLVADTSKVRHVVPEMQKMNETMGQMGGAPGGAGTGGADDSGGFLGSVKDALGLGGGGDGGKTDEVVARADSLTNEYAGKLQQRLEQNGKWEAIRIQAAREAGVEVDGPGAGADVGDGAEGSDDSGDEAGSGDESA